MTSAMRAVRCLCILSLVHFDLVHAQRTPEACAADDGEWKCDEGCYDEEDEACHAGLDKNGCAEIYGHVEWGPLCNCRCAKMVKICDMGCYDEEDEACHAGLDKNACAEIYGHVEWAAKCNCRIGENGTAIDQRTAEARSGETSIYFSVPAFVVLFRESFEVMIILAIVIQYLNKAKEEGTIDDAMLNKLRREVYVGASVGFFICMGIGILCILAASAVYQLFEGDAVYWADGIMMSLAAVFLTGLALNFYKLIYTRECHERKIREQVMEVIEACASQKEDAKIGKKYAFFFFALVTGLREGLESVIFLISVITDFPDPSYMASLPIPIILALVLSRILGFMFFQSTKRCSIKPFVRSACFGCCSIACGMFISSMHKWQELGLFGTWSPKSERPWLNHRVFDASGCCNDKTNKFFVLLRALCGWQDQPTPVEFFAFPLYWLIVVPLLFWRITVWKKEVEAKLEQWRLEDGEAGVVEAVEASPKVSPEPDQEGNYDGVTVVNATVLGKDANGGAATVVNA